MKRGMTIEYLKYREVLNFKVDFGVNGAIGTIVTKWDISFYSDNGSFSLIILFNTHDMPLNVTLLSTVLYVITYKHNDYTISKNNYVLTYNYFVYLHILLYQLINMLHN